MMENMVSEVARAMQDDRRAQAAKQARIIEAERAHRPHAEGTRLRTHRAAIAKALMALATRLAPPAPTEAPRPGMATRAMR